MKTLRLMPTLLGLCTLVIFFSCDKEEDSNTNSNPNSNGTQPYIELITAQDVGKVMKFSINVPIEDKVDAWIDINNNHKKDTALGEDDIKLWTANENSTHSFNVISQTIRIYGNVTSFILERCYHCEGITRFDASNNAHFEELDVSYNSSKKLKCINVKGLKLGSGFESLDLSECPNLERLNIGSSPDFSSLDLSNCPNLKRLSISSPRFKRLSLSKNTQLRNLIISNSLIRFLDVSHCTNLGVGYDEEGVKNRFRYSCYSTSTNTCIKVSQEQLDNTEKKWLIDFFATLALRCSNE